MMNALSKKAEEYEMKIKAHKTKIIIIWRTESETISIGAPPPEGGPVVIEEIDSSIGYIDFWYPAGERQVTYPFGTEPPRWEDPVRKSDYGKITFSVTGGQLGWSSFGFQAHGTVTLGAVTVFWTGQDPQYPGRVNSR